MSSKQLQKRSKRGATELAIWEQFTRERCDSSLNSVAVCRMCSIKMPASIPDLETHLKHCKRRNTDDADDDSNSSIKQREDDSGIVFKKIKRKTGIETSFVKLEEQNSTSPVQVPDDNKDSGIIEFKPTFQEFPPLQERAHDVDIKVEVLIKSETELITGDTIVKCELIEEETSVSDNSVPVISQITRQKATSSNKSHKRDCSRPWRGTSPNPDSSDPNISQVSTCASEENCEEPTNSNHSVLSSDLTVSGSRSFKEIFDEKLIEYDNNHQGSQRKPWTHERITEVIREIKVAKEAKRPGQRRTPMDYYWMGKYDIISDGSEDCLAISAKSKRPLVRIIAREQYYDCLTEIHASCEHGGRDKMLNELKTKYAYYIPKKAVEIFISLCPQCATKRYFGKKTAILSSTNGSRVSCYFNALGQFDIIDFQSCPDGDYKWLLIYEDIFSKFLNLRPLKTKRVGELAIELTKIFTSFGAPEVLQSANETEDLKNILYMIWPDCNIVPRIEGSSESCHDIENMLRSWMDDNKTSKWSLGCYWVQFQRNALVNPEIGKSPYKTIFGSEPKESFNFSTIEQFKIEPEGELK